MISFELLHEVIYAFDQHIFSQQKQHAVCDTKQQLRWILLIKLTFSLVTRSLASASKPSIDIPVFITMKYNVHKSSNHNLTSHIKAKAEKTKKVNHKNKTLCKN